jgi:hypothetical protein
MRDDSSIDPAGTQQPPQAPYGSGLQPQTPQATEPAAATESAGTGPIAATGPDAATEPAQAAGGTGVPQAQTTAEQSQGQPPSAPPSTAQDQGIWDAAKADEIRHRWHDVQTHFVEDPRGSVTEARQLVDEAVRGLAASVHDREEQLEHAGARASDSTEGMRDTVLQYHQLLDRLLAV